MKIAEMLDAAKHAKGVETDYALAKSLGLPKQRVSDYYKGKTAPDEFACMQIAIAIGKPLDEVIAAVKVETEKDEKRREAWENYMKRLGGMAASFMAVAFSLVTFIVTSPSADACESKAYDVGISRIQIMR